MADPDAFNAEANQAFARAQRLGFPAFLTSIAESSPANAAPYLCRYQEFRAVASQWLEREPLLAALDKVRSASEDCGVVVEAILIGGSFVALSDASPRDVDCLMFYRKARRDRPVQATRLGELQRQAKRIRIDVRFIPIDGDPLPLIKSVSYFTLLYSMANPAKAETDAGHRRGLLLLVCTG